MNGKRWLSLALALVMIFSLGTAAFAVEQEQEKGESKPITELPVNYEEEFPADPEDPYQAGEQVHAIVLTESQPTAENHNPFQKLFNTYEKLLKEHAAVMERMRQKAIDFVLDFEYTALLNGMAITVDYADLDAIAALPGVTDVVISEQYTLPDTEPTSVYASDMIDADWLNDEIAADGSGKVIAIIDSGVKLDHEAFGTYSGMLQTPAYTKTEMQKAISQLGHGAYYSQKIPFQYDYADNDQNAMDDYSGHGSHVAGIAAGYVATDEGEITFRGSAPDAQILAMKIFHTGGVNTDAALFTAALDDAFKLGADVINMSVGRPSGFVEDGISELYDRIFERLENAGIICCVAAGNDASTAKNALTRAGNGYLLTSDIDYGMLSSPGAYNGNIAVASAQNAGVPEYRITIGGKGHLYRGSSDGPSFLSAFADQDLAYEVVPNLGAPEDYQEIDVSGKVAVIARGEIPFVDKVANAENAGASAVIICDNRSGDLVSMSLKDSKIPAIFVSQVTGAALRAQEEKLLHVNAEKTIDMSAETWRMADTSSWGPTNDLQIKPAITGIGGGVISVDYETKNGYKSMSGTSMATPNVAGGYASLLDAISEANPDLSKPEAAAIALNRTLSSAYPMTAYNTTNADGSVSSVLYSPRKQGAGAMNLRAAYNTVLTIQDPLAELGDDPAKTGVYTISSTVQNTGDTERSYTIRADVMTDDVMSKNIGTAAAPNYHIYNTATPHALRADTDYTLDAPEIITLGPGEEQTVTATITLSEAFKADYLNTNFENGSFIEGYVTFDSLENEDSLLQESQHITFLAFYGDWTAAPIMEAHDWRDLMVLNDDHINSWRPHVDWEVETIPTKANLVDEYESPKLYAGDAPLGYPGGNRDYIDARIAVSNNTDSALYTRMLIAPINVRNARHIIMLIRDAESGKIYAADDREYCKKITYNALFGWRATNKYMFEGMDTYSGTNPIALPNETKVVIEFYANLPCVEDELGAMTMEEIAANGAQYLAYSMPCVVDSEAPVIESCDYDRETGVVTVTARDNQFLAGIAAVDADGNYLAETQSFADAQPGERHTVTMQVGAQGAFRVVAMDYATNETSQKVTSAVAITKQPQDADVRWGQTAKFAVQASGDGLTYQWQYKSRLSQTWINYLLPGGKTDTISVLATSLLNGVEYRCVVKDANGQTVTSDPAKLTVESLLSILFHPKSRTAVSGTEAQFSVGAEGENLSYQWQTKASDASEWENASVPGAQTDTITVQATEELNGQQYRCVVMCEEESVTTEAATLTVVKPDVGQLPFLDVCSGDWFYDAVRYVVANGFMNGTSSTLFASNGTMTRAMLVTILYRMEKSPKVTGENPFTDVKAGQWYTDAVIWANAKGIVEGYGGGKFGPMDTLTREQFAAMLQRYARYKDYNVGKTADLSGYADAKQISPWAKAAMQWANAEGLITGRSETTLVPKGSATRAETATILMRFQETVCE